ncbi:MAG: hypothetical protein ACFFD2_01980 [Promethearchaeota archaeon]
MTEDQNTKFLSIIKRIIISLFIIGSILIVQYLVLPIYINSLPAVFYSFTYLGFIMVILSGTFLILFLLKIQIFTIYIAFIWLSSGIIILVLNKFVHEKFFSDLLLKYFHPLYAVLFCVVGATILMIEIVRYLYLKYPNKP